MDALAFGLPATWDTYPPAFIDAYKVTRGALVDRRRFDNKAAEANEQAGL